MKPTHALIYLSTLRFFQWCATRTRYAWVWMVAALFFIFYPKKFSEKVFSRD